MNKKLEVELNYKNLSTLATSYNKEDLVNALKKVGEKPLGGFSVDDALENAWLEGAKAATQLIRTGLNMWFCDEEEENE